MIFLTEDARNNLHEGKEVEANGYITIITRNKKNLDFSTVKEMIAKYKINSNAKKNEVGISSNLVNGLEHDNFIVINFNPKKSKVNIDDILDNDNGGKEKLSFMIEDNKSISYVCMADVNMLTNNYVFMDEISNFSEPLKI